MAMDMGYTVCLLIEGIDVVVISGTMQPLDNSRMRLAGLDPRDYRIIVAKSSKHRRSWWSQSSNVMIDCDAPGIASSDLSTFTYTKKTRKIFPMYGDTVYLEAGNFAGGSTKWKISPSS